ncbi:hypothetical protein JGU71_06755 [Antrihabitans sp. YC3-6]|uniref:Uncharacterized protein n=1 Tax=Antrihabitans stalagmiti TaxID=2799499 RepID=A0A934NNN0_9NOCA|nr:hypothetical protein [Antrihabitans stalagmiti]MBJ8338578.1 hypothetical protein [Antrihabitans stalagmiti]
MIKREYNFVTEDAAALASICAAEDNRVEVAQTVRHAPIVATTQNRATKIRTEGGNAKRI